MDFIIKYFDIIIFALITLFLIIKIGTILGRRDGFEAKIEVPRLKKAQTSDIVQNNHLDAQEDDQKPARTYAKDSVEEGISIIQEHDGSFSYREFRRLSEDLFKEVTQAFYRGDIDAISHKISRKLYDSMKDYVQQNRKNLYNVEILDFLMSDITDVKIDQLKATIKVKFMTYQNLVDLQSGRVLKKKEVVSENFYFTKDLSAQGDWKVSLISQK